MENKTKNKFENRIRFLRGDRVLSGFENLINDQAELSVSAGQPFGFARVYALSMLGKSKEAIQEVIDKTDLTMYRDEVHKFNFYAPVGQKSYETFYEGATPYPHFEEEYKIVKSSFLGRDQGTAYVDVCLFGAKLAENVRDYKNAREFYNRANEVLNAYEGYTGWSERKDSWKHGMKRMYKLGAFENKKNCLTKLIGNIKSS